MISFDKIVNKMWKKWWKILFKQDIFEIIDPEKKPSNQNLVDKTVYKLKAAGVIHSLKAWVYIVPSEQDRVLNKVDLLEKYYLKLLKKYITHFTGSSYYISWTKSLQFHLKDFSVPEKIFIITRDLNKKIQVGNYQIIFKTISGKQEGKKINLYAKMQDFVVYKTLDWLEFKISNLELALLESAQISDSVNGLDFSLLNKAIKKYSSELDHEVFHKIGKYKFIMSFNRLKEIAKHINQDLYQCFLDIIKQNGGLFIWEGLRGF